MRSITLHIRVTPELRDGLNKASKAVGIGSSEWVRGLIVGALEGRGVPQDKPEPVQAPIPAMKVIKSPREAVERLKGSAAPRGRAFAAYE